MKGEKLSEINNQMFEILLEIQELKAQCFSNRQIKVMIKHKHFDQKLAYDDDKLDELISIANKSIYAEHYEKDALHQAIALNQLEFLYRDTKDDNRLKLDILKESNKVRGLDKQKIENSGETKQNIKLTYKFVDENDDDDTEEKS